jgi:hypothetical protein
MRRVPWVALLGALAIWGCQTITEELPSRPSPVSTTQPIPVIVVPVPVPSSAPAPTPTAAPAPNPTPQQPQPTPRPQPTSQPQPQPQPQPGGSGRIARVGAKVFFLECGGNMVPGSERATETELGCRIHYDCQGKDADNNPVDPRNTPSWTFSPDSLVRVNNSTDFTPTAQTRGRGTVCAWAVMDGVRSNDVCVTIR